MGEIINLNKARKDKAKVAAKAKAAENKSFWGRTRGEKTRLQIELEKAKKALDQHKRED
ncbi:MAG: DUF4169 family protein [Alphaproteobacteria bacterium]